MSSSKHIDTICVVIVVLALVLTVLFMNGEALGIRKIVDEDAETYAGGEWFTANDLNADWDDSSATVITLNGTEAKVSGSGAYAYDGGVVISNGGWYVLSGTLTDGSITVDAYSSSKVWLKLSGVDVTCSDDAALRVNQAEKVFVTLAEGTENYLTSGEAYSDAALSDGAGGTIFAHDDLTINGSGSLTVTANYKHGVDANDEFVITGGTISITAPQDAIHVNDAFRFCAADLTIDAGDDGIHCDTEICIESGTILITECYEGIEAVTIDVSGGDITIYPTDDGFNANGGSDSFGFGMMGGGFGGNADSESADDSEDAETWLHISGGAITIINQTGNDADGLDSNGDLIISGGTVLVSLVNNGNNSALDYGSENGGVAEISGGTVIACGNSSMAESFDSSSEQPSILYNVSAGVEAGTALSLEDADGNVLVSWEVPCSFSSAVISCPELTVGESYLVVIGDDAEQIELTETSASYGGAQSGGFGGSTNWGGMQDRDSFEGTEGSGGGMRGGRGGSSGEDGERPELPEGMEPSDMGELPDMSEMGEPTELPDGSGFPEGGGMPGTENAQDGETETTDTAEDGYSAETWVLLGVSALVLLLGLLIGFKYKY